MHDAGTHEDVEAGARQSEPVQVSGASGIATSRAGDRLGRIQTVADAALTHLDVDDLLTELLDRVLEVIGADTAAILLLDERSEELVATAARGIEEEVRQGVRIPLGSGFAGRIAAEKRPIMLDRVDSTTVWNPILWEKGIRAMVGVPLLSAGRVMGVLHVGTYGSQRFGPDDVELLQLAAERIAGATQSQVAATERATALRLQRSLLPGALPRLAAFDFAARYVAADEGVGGDWYDVFVLPSGVLWVVTGDVAGHGLEAAVVMGRLRSTIRAYALDGGSPEGVLERTDRKLRHFEPGEIATVVCAVWEPPFQTARISTAGHVPPVLAAPEQPAVVLDLEPDPPLGVTGRRGRIATYVPVPPGSVMVFYTDGLVERRSESLDVGLDRLRAAVDIGHPAVVLHRVMAALIGSDQPADDVAVLTVRRALDR
jgi:putative methionine-R-sulfoxide reductase with GAF domain